MSTIKTPLLFITKGKDADGKTVEPEHEWIEKELPAKREVCPTCRGEGVTDPWPGGMTGSEHDEMDWETREAYASGFYDKKCSDCDGDRVIWALDVDNISDEDRQAWENAIEQERADEAEAAAERRWGA